MGKTLVISDQLAALLEERRADGGYKSLDAAAEAYIVQGISGESAEDDNAGYTVDELRALIAEGETSGPAVRWDAEEFRAEVKRRHAESKKR